MSVVVIMDTVPVRDVLATTVVVVSLVDMGPPRTSLVGSGLEWPGECHGSRLVSSECRWSTPNGMTRPWVLWCGYSALPMQSVFNLSIAASSVMGTSS